MKVLISAFKPFNNMPNNYSSEVLNYISGVDKVILDVVYDNCVGSYRYEVKVNDKIVTELGTKVTENDIVKFNA